MMHFIVSLSLFDVPGNQLEVPTGTMMKHVIEHKYVIYIYTTCSLSTCLLFSGCIHTDTSMGPGFCLWPVETSLVQVERSTPLTSRRWMLPGRSWRLNCRNFCIAHKRFNMLPRDVLWKPKNS